MVKVRYNYIFGKKMRGSTMIETIIAMVILVSIFLLGITIYIKVLDTSIQFQNIQAYHLAKKALDVTHKDQSYFDETLENGTLTIVKKVQISGYSDKLFLVNVAILGPKKDTLAKMRKFMIHDED